MDENKRQDSMIEDLLRDRRDMLQGDTFNNGRKAEQGTNNAI